MRHAKPKNQRLPISKNKDHPQQARMEFTIAHAPVQPWHKVSTDDTLSMLDTTDNQIKVWSGQLTAMQTISDSIRVFAKASEASGGFVVIHPDFNCLPVLLGKDGSLVFLYQFVEAIDEKLDHDELKAEYPMLSYGQIAGGIAFLRRLAQFNDKNVDIDELEHTLTADGEDLQSGILRAIEVGMVHRVHPE